MTLEQLTLALGLVLRPFLLFLILAIFAVPATLAVRKWMPKGRIKSLLLDRTLFERRKLLAWGLMIGIYVLLFIGIALYHG